MPFMWGVVLRILLAPLPLACKNGHSMPRDSGVVPSITSNDPTFIGKISYNLLFTWAVCLRVRQH